MKLRRMRQKRGLAADRLELVLRYCAAAPRPKARTWREYARWDLHYDSDGTFIGYQWSLPE